MNEERNEVEKYVEICKQPFKPEFEKMMKEKVIPHVDMTHFKILMEQAGKICIEREVWNNCDNIIMLIEQLKIELKMLIEYNKVWKHQEKDTDADKP